MNTIKIVPWQKRKKMRTLLPIHNWNPTQSNAQGPTSGITRSLCTSSRQSQSKVSPSSAFNFGGRILQHNDFCEWRQASTHWKQLIENKAEIAENHFLYDYTEKAGTGPQNLYNVLAHMLKAYDDGALNSNHQDAEQHWWNDKEQSAACMTRSAKKIARPAGPAPKLWEMEWSIFSHCWVARRSSAWI